MKYPKISIITPSFNQGAFLEQTILSVIGQGYPNLEYIIIDGGSNDNSVEIIKRYSSFLYYWKSEPDNGQSDAINRGFSKSSGEILAWLNSDDLYLPGALFSMANIFLSSNKKDSIFFGNCIHFGQADTEVYVAGSDVAKQAALYPLKLYDYIIQPSSFWSKVVWSQIGELNTEMHYGFDWEWFLRAEVAGIKLQALSSPLSLYRIHTNHKSGTGGERRVKELAMLYSKYAGDKSSDLYLQLVKFYSFPLPESKWLRLKRKLINRFRPASSEGDLLKRLYVGQFGRFSTRELDAVLKMVK